jgi:hypothetical protein
MTFTQKILLIMIAIAMLLVIGIGFDKGYNPEPVAGSGYMANVTIIDCNTTVYQGNWSLPYLRNVTSWCSNQ